MNFQRGNPEQVQLWKCETRNAPQLISRVPLFLFCLTTLKPGIFVISDMSVQTVTDKLCRVLVLSGVRQCHTDD